MMNFAYITLLKLLLDIKGTELARAVVAQSVSFYSTDRTTGVRSPTEEEDFSSSFCVQTGSGAHPASCTMGTGILSPGVKRGRGVMLTTHPHLVPRLRMSRSYTCSPHAPPLRVVRSLYHFFTELAQNCLRTEQNPSSLSGNKIEN
jgi:hypothetical protein